ncbi:MAG: NADH-quinone oxidoreductase subunit NuoE [Limnohabitans sp.]
MLSDATRARFAREVAKYPADQQQSAVMACLSILQQEQGYVSAEGELAVAEYLGMAPMAVHEVSTFYNMYNLKPVGRFKINVCTNLPCTLRGGGQALERLCQRLDVEVGGTTADGLFTLQPGECMGACADAPVLLVNDRNMCSYMSDDKLDQLIEGLRQAEGQS